MRTCSLCGKGTKTGRNRSHAQNRTSRTFKANVQKVTLKVGEGNVSGVFCTKCLKKMKGEIKKTALSK
ncbi:50S ribosomal protein L28 [Patescibacteria group bacterium]|nr:50S ribosomal protein L28 [Patescibacteria group bacterium]